MIRAQDGLRVWRARDGRESVPGHSPSHSNRQTHTRYIPSARTNVLRRSFCDTSTAHSSSAGEIDELSARDPRHLHQNRLRYTPASVDAAAMGFGDFSSICERTPLPLCPLVGSESAITGSHFTQTQCYARSIELANTIIFQGAAGFAHIIALLMLVIMIIHVRSKFTAVGMSKQNI